MSIATKRKEEATIDIGIAEQHREAIAGALSEVLTQRLHVHSKTAWMLRSHLE